MVICASGICPHRLSLCYILRCTAHRCAETNLGCRSHYDLHQVTVPMSGPATRTTRVQGETLWRSKVLRELLSNLLLPFWLAGSGELQSTETRKHSAGPQTWGDRAFYQAWWGWRQHRLGPMKLQITPVITVSNQDLQGHIRTPHI